MYSGFPFSALAGVWAALSCAVAGLVTRRRVPAALLTGLLVAAWPRVEMALQGHPLYGRVAGLQIRLLQAIDRFQRRRHWDEYERERRERIERLGFDPEVGPPHLATLRRVIPLGQAVRLEDATLMALSVELYEEGFVVHTRLSMDEEPDQSPDPFGFPSEHTFPELEGIGVRDDRGHRYRIEPGGGGGGGREWRFEHRSGEPLDPEARELVLELSGIGWRTFPRGRGEPRVDRVSAGPWRFTVPL